MNKIIRNVVLLTLVALPYQSRAGSKMDVLLNEVIQFEKLDKPTRDDAVLQLMSELIDQSEPSSSQKNQVVKTLHLVIDVEEKIPQEDRYTLGTTDQISLIVLKGSNMNQTWLMESLFPRIIFPKEPNNVSLIDRIESALALAAINTDANYKHRLIDFVNEVKTDSSLIPPYRAMVEKRLKVLASKNP